MYSSIGIIKYSTNPNKLIVEVDQEIQNYYRSQIPIKTNKQKYGAHITVMRGEEPNELVYSFHNQEIQFWYDHYLFSDNKYFWLKVVCPELKNIRKTIGLNSTDKLTHSPDGRHSFHITIANVKNI